MPDLKMPSLGADMEFGTLVEWRVKPGDSLRRGDIIAEVETQKGVFEIDVREDAVVGELLVAEGTRVNVGAPMATLVAPGIAGTAPPIRPTPPVQVVRPAEPAPGDGMRPAPHPRASPLARRVAQELGIELGAVQGTGEGGVVTRADVERAAAAGTPPEPRAAPAASQEPSATTQPPTLAAGMREAIGAAMARSKREIPHYYLSEDIELGAAMEWLRATNAARPVANRILPVALLLKAVARALTKFPELNGFFVDGSFRASDHVHLGVAITIRGGGLVAPAIHDAETLSVSDLMVALSEIVRRARQGGLRASEITDPTITVTNLGDEGARTVFGVITPPQVAIVGFGTIEERAWAEHGLIGVRPVVTASLCADHRVSDGWRGARFLREVRSLLGKPEEL